MLGAIFAKFAIIVIASIISDAKNKSQITFNWFCQTTRSEWSLEIAKSMENK